MFLVHYKHGEYEPRCYIGKEDRPVGVERYKVFDEFEDAVRFAVEGDLLDHNNHLFECLNIYPIGDIIKFRESAEYTEALAYCRLKNMALEDISKIIHSLNQYNESMKEQSRFMYTVNQQNLKFTKESKARIDANNTNLDNKIKEQLDKLSECMQYISDDEARQMDKDWGHIIPYPYYRFFLECKGLK